MRKLTVLMLSISMLFLVGCGVRPAKRLNAPSYDSSAIASAAIKQYDKNGNGVVDGDELKDALCLKSAFPELTSVSATDITNRVRMWNETRIGLMDASVKVTKKGAPVADAVVNVASEDFMGEPKISFSTTTNASGLSTLSSANTDDLPGIKCGFYKLDVSVNGKTYHFGIEISKDSASLNDGVANLELKDQD